MYGSIGNNSSDMKQLVISGGLSNYNANHEMYAYFPLIIHSDLRFPISALHNCKQGTGAKGCNAANPMHTHTHIH